MLFVSGRRKSQVKQTLFLALLILLIVASAVFALNGTLTGNLPADPAASVPAETPGNSQEPPEALPVQVEEPATETPGTAAPDVPQNISQPVPEPPQDTALPSPGANASQSPEQPADIQAPAEPAPSEPGAGGPEAAGGNTSTEMPDSNATETPPTQGGNQTANLTGPLPETPSNRTNATWPEQPGANLTGTPNLTGPAGNRTEPQAPGANETELPGVQEPSVQVFISGPPRITRAGSFTLTATAANTGTAATTGLILDWLLPAGFVTSDPLSFSCGPLEPGASCSHSITVQVPISAGLGSNEVRVTATYG